jgi:uncharacterized membrane protein YgcG
MKLLLIVLLSLLTFGCGKAPGVHHDIRVFKAHSVEDDIDLYYYVMLLDNNNYQYITSSVPLNTVKDAPWTLSNRSPLPTGSSSVKVEEKPELETEELEADIVEAEAATESEASSSEASSESSGDSGGGDSGGGE